MKLSALVAESMLIQNTAGSPKCVIRELCRISDSGGVWANLGGCKFSWL